MLLGYVDNHVKGPILKGLLRRGMDVVRAQDRGMCGKDDELLLMGATTEARLMITNDQDFLVLHAVWLPAGRAHAGIVYWHQDKYRIGEAISRILDYATQTSASAAANVVHYL